MPFKIITVPFDAERVCFVEETLNAFCLNKTVVGYKAEFFQDGTGSYWTVFLEYKQVLEIGGKAEPLSSEQLLLLKRLREWRKEKADETGVPVYVIYTNKQATELVKKGPKSLEALKAIEGFGKKKLESFGKELVGLITDFYEVKHD